jgi:type IV pilus assembly protein PilB
MHRSETIESGGKHNPRRRLGDLILTANLIDPETLGRALETQARTGARLGEILMGMAAIDETILARCLAIQWGFPFLDLGETPVDPKAVSAVGESIAREHDAMPVSVTQRLLTVALADPRDFTAVQNIGFSTGLQIRPAVAALGDIRRSIDRNYGGRVCRDRPVQPSFPRSAGEESQSIRSGLPEYGDEGTSLEEPNGSASVVRLVNRIIGRAIQLRASDIHVEPGRRDLRVRYRIDGLLKEDLRMSGDVLAALVSRIKILSCLDIAEKRLPQDGAIRFSFDEREIDLRVSTLPTHYGEKVVVRVLDRHRTVVSVDDLGFTPRHARSVGAFLQKKQGILLITGPTGSGKTTTLYAFIRALATETENIVTVEDPIEYHLDGISQVQVKPGIGLTFAACLRSILRQDPNIILVGEIRDLETAEIAVRAAMTGHLVLSTLHTNDAPSAVTRLADLGIPRYLIASTLIGVIAQRLVRRVCGRCAATVQMADGESRYGGLFHGISSHRKGAGCSACRHQGVAGRIGIFEILDASAPVAEAIASGASQQALRGMAAASGMKSLIEDGIEKVRGGLVTPEELLRVVELPTDDPAEPSGSQPERTEPVRGS